jgi:hypothetical protein
VSDGSVEVSDGSVEVSDGSVEVSDGSVEEVDKYLQDYKFFNCDFTPLDDIKDSHAGRFVFRRCHFINCIWPETFWDRHRSEECVKATLVDHYPLEIYLSVLYEGGQCLSLDRRELCAHLNTNGYLVSGQHPSRQVRVDFYLWQCLESLGSVGYPHLTPEKDFSAYFKSYGATEKYWLYYHVYSKSKICQHPPTLRAISPREALYRSADDIMTRIENDPSLKSGIDKINDYIASQAQIDQKVLRHIMSMKRALDIPLVRENSGGGVDMSFLDFSHQKISMTFKADVFCYANLNGATLCPDPEMGFCGTIFYRSQCLHLDLGGHPWCRSHHPDFKDARVDRATILTFPKSARKLLIG